MASNLSSLPPRILTFGPERRAIDIGLYARIAQKQPLLLECGRELQDIPIAYQAFGTLNAEKSNAILICHALTGDQFVLGTHPVTGKDGWWTELVGPGKPVDTDQYYVICSNILGGCMGSYGPKDIDPDTGESYGIRFPVLTIRDMVRAQALLLETLGIHRLHSIIGGSMGGMQVLEWLRSYPERVNSAVVTATAARHTPQNIAFHEIGRQAVMADPEWCEGRYTEEGRFPSRGLAVARMTAHVTYLSEEALSRKFGRNLQNRQQVSFGFDADFQVESYLRHQGKSFVERFDPNSYLYITRAVDYFDLAEEHNGRLSEAFSQCDARVCVAAFSSDWLFPPSESRAIVRALSSMAAHVSYVEIETDKGHDAFLLDVPEFTETVRGFLRGPKTAGKS